MIPETVPNAPRYDAFLASVIANLKAEGLPIRRLDLIRELRVSTGSPLREARDAVDDYCARNDIVLAKPAASRSKTALQLRLPILLLLAAAGFIAYSITAQRSHSHLPWTLLTDGLAALLTWQFVRGLMQGGFQASLAHIKQIRPRMIVQNTLLVAVTFLTAFGLLKLFPFLNLSWVYLIPGNDGQPVNIGLAPLRIKYFGILFLLLFALNIPRLAYAEEMTYRRGTKDWRDGLARSLRFGLAHCVVGVPVYAGLALSISGLWYTYQYFRGGVPTSTLHHATYNLVIVTVLFFTLLFVPLGH